MAYEHIVCWGCAITSCLIFDAHHSEEICTLPGLSWAHTPSPAHAGGLLGPSEMYWTSSEPTGDISLTQFPLQSPGHPLTGSSWYTCLSTDCWFFLPHAPGRGSPCWADCIRSSKCSFCGCVQPVLLTSLVTRLVRFYCYHRAGERMGLQVSYARMVTFLQVFSWINTPWVVRD